MSKEIYNEDLAIVDSIKGSIKDTIAIDNILSGSVITVGSSIINSSGGHDRHLIKIDAASATDIIKSLKEVRVKLQGNIKGCIEELSKNINKPICHQA